MIKTRINNEYKDIVKIFCGGNLQKEITKVWSREANDYVYLAETIVEYTGSLPVTINADGNTLINYRIYGGDGGVGEQTENLLDKMEIQNNANINQSTGVVITSIATMLSDYIRVARGQTYIIKATVDGTLFSENSRPIGLYDEQKIYVGSSALTSVSPAKMVDGFEITIPSTLYSDTNYIRVGMDKAMTNIMLNLGSTALPYEPYGYKLPMASRGENSLIETPVYIGDTPLGEDEYVDYGEQKVYKRKTLKDIGDTVSVNGDLWDIVNYNNNFTRATLLRHETMPAMAYSARQAIYAFPNGLAAGDYHFTIAQHSWVAEDVGKTLTFTLTQAIPDGGQLVLNAAYNETLVGTTISSYASPTTTTAIETVTMTEGDSGTDLGSLTNAGTPASNINSLQKALLGSNEWKTSALRQYLNSDKAAGSVWIPQTIFDRPPVWAINTAGFMNGLDEDFLSCVTDTTYVTVRNTMSDGGGTDTLTDKFYLPSRTEIFGDNEITNTPEGTLYQYYVNATNADRIKYRANSASSWWLRTPLATNAYPVRQVNTTGALQYNSARTALGFAPACQIDLTKLNNSWILANFYKPTLTPTDPPVPLPALPTIDGTTVIDCELADKLSQMYVKYKAKR